MKPSEEIKQVVEGLEAELEFWKTPEGHKGGPITLCKVNSQLGNKGCEGCPVWYDTHGAGCPQTPYALFAHAPDIQHKREAIRKEHDYLKYLLEFWKSMTPRKLGQLKKRNAQV